MVRALVDFCVRRSVPVTLLMWTLLIGGAVALLSMRREFFPETAPQAARIVLVYPGASPKEIEESMARKIEDRVIDVEGVDRIETRLSEGTGGITVKLKASADPDKAIEDIRLAIEQINDLPPEAERVRVFDFKPNFPTIMVTLASDAGEEYIKRELRAIRDDLKSLEGMGTLVEIGLRPREIHVDVDPTALLRHGIRLSEVSDLVAAAMAEVPGGTVRTDAANLSVRTMGGAESVTAIRGIVLRSAVDGSSLLLGEIAEIREQFEDVPQVRRFGGKPAGTLVAFKEGDEDAVEIAELVRGYVAGRNGEPARDLFKDRLYRTAWERGHELGASRPPVDGTLARHNDLARIIEGRFELLSTNAVQGAILVLIVLLLGLNRVASLWVMVGIVIAVACTLMFMQATGVTLNLITMFGLLIVLGMLADDAIVMSENILKRHKDLGEPPLTAAVNGVTQVFWPVVGSVTTTIIAFVPLVFIKGNIGELLGNLPVVVLIALASSLFEASFMMPNHMAHALVRAERAAGRGGSRVDRLLRPLADFRERRIAGMLERYDRAVRWCLRERYIVLAATTAALVGSAGMVLGGRLPFVFLPADDTETVIVDFQLPIGATMEQTSAVARRIEDAARAQPEVQALTASLGSSVDFETGATNAAATHIGQIFIELSPVEERSRRSGEVVDAIRTAAGTLDEVETLKFQEVSGGPAGTDLAFEVRGADDAQVDACVARIKAALGGFSGVKDISDDADDAQRELRIELTPQALAMGFTTADVARQVRTAVFGTEAHTFSADREDVDVRVQFDERSRRRLASLEELWLVSPAGPAVPLVEVADVREGRGYSTIRRVDRERTVTVGADCDDGTNPEIVASALRPEIAAIAASMPGIEIDAAGRQKDLIDAFSSFPIALMAAFLGIYVILAWLFESYLQPLAVMLAIPFGVIGIVWGHLLLGFDLTFLSLIGFVALAGVVVNNSLILVEFANEMRAQGVALPEALARAGRLRLVPIVITTVTTLAGLAPLMLEQSFQARFLIPMAISLVFGLMSSTVLTLFALPAAMVAIDDLVRAWRRLWTGRAEASSPRAEGFSS
ncbi:MAG: efflux RND transporter permease subunit [Planctomycetota bacterium]